MGILFSVAGCFSDPGAEPCDPGTLACACFGAGECLPGLVCQVGVCAVEDGSTGMGEGSTSVDASESTTAVSESTAVASESTAAASESTAVASESTTEPVDACGNGILEPDELCDGGPGCTDCVLDMFSCNPLNDAGCPEGAHCTYIADGAFGCRLSPDEPGPVDAECPDLYSGNACETGLTCLLDCASFCCTPWCDVLDIYASCPEDMACVPFWVANPNDYLGLDWLGRCRRP